VRDLDREFFMREAHAFKSKSDLEGDGESAGPGGKDIRFGRGGLHWENREVVVKKRNRQTM
jgi:hypothetical protein